MTRDELKQAIGRAICDLRDVPGECTACAAAGYACPDAWYNLHAQVNAIMALVDTYSVEIMQEVSPCFSRKVGAQGVRAWLKARKPPPWI